MVPTMRITVPFAEYFFCEDIDDPSAAEVAPGENEGDGEFVSVEVEYIKGAS